MSRYITLRLALPLVLSAALLPAAVFAQSQDTDSVAEAARRAREQKKAQTKPAKIITEDDVKPAPQPAPAAPSTPAAPAAPDAAAAATEPAPPATSTAPAGARAEASAASAIPAAATPDAAGSSPSPDPKDQKDQKDSKELAELKAKIKEAESDLDLLKRSQSLENDTYYSNTDYIHDTAGKEKLDALKQQITDKQQDLERLKAKLAELQPAQDTPASAPPKL